MRKQYVGLDILRGLGIFILIWMHSAFYYFDGLYDLDLNNPPAIVTVIGLLLMFAGVFAMVSGTVHTYQFYRKTEIQGYSNASLLKYNTVSGLLILAVAYMYFIFTGPGLAQMELRSMNNSILVDAIRNGIYKGFNLERILYVDSLVMLGINILLIGLVFLLIQKCSGMGEFKKSEGERDYFTNMEFLDKVHEKTAKLFLISGLGFFALSLLRVPLYQIYITALDQDQYGKVLLLNWLVNKNNPIMPYLSFALIGGWIATLLVIGNWKRIVKLVMPVAVVLFIIGVVLYIKLPDTMLERSIDFKWFAIMTAQLGLFMMLMLLVLRVFDFGKDKENILEHKKLTRFPKFFYRFGVAGLTPFFLESLVSAIVFRKLSFFMPGLSFDIKESLIYGFCLAIMWGLLLMLWEKKEYKYGIEYFYVRILRKLGSSAKEEKLSSKDL
jgi:hypothetical protein